MGACIHATTVAEGIKFGLQKSVGKKDENRIFEILARYGPWIRQYRGGMPALNVAAGINHESHGDPTSTSSKRIQESGLWSILGPNAEAEDLDPFDPECNILMGARLRNKRVKKIITDERYFWLGDHDMDPYEYTKLLWTLPGSLGMGGWRKMVDWAFRRRVPKVGTFQREHPYEFMRRKIQKPFWVKKFQEKMDADERIGRMTMACVACRIVRTATVDWLKENNGLAKPGSTRVAKIPEGLAEFDPDKYAAVWATPKKERHERFPEYLRIPELDTHAVRDNIPPPFDI